jgi:glycosyltransferase involved in cell wall biosynthesis
MTSFSPLISVVIPSYNHAHFIGEALESLLSQSYTSWEALVVDNHSTDDTEQVLKRYNDDRIKLFKINNEGIIAVSRNTGIKNAKGEWISFLDSDDWWKPHKLQKIVFEINEGAEFIYHDLQVIEDGKKKGKLKGLQTSDSLFNRLIAYGNFIPNSAVTVKRSLLSEVGNINESRDMIAAEDYNTWLKISRITSKVSYISQNLGYYRIHNAGVSNKDMSVPMAAATKDFQNEAADKHFRQHQCLLKYIKGRYLFQIKQYADALSCFKKALNSPNKIIAFKSFVMTVRVWTKKITG